MKAGLVRQLWGLGLIAASAVMAAMLWARPVALPEVQISPAAYQGTESHDAHPAMPAVPELTELAAVLDRPLFQATRRPPRDEAQRNRAARAGEAGLTGQSAQLDRPWPEYRLVGISQIAGRPYAVLGHKGGKQGQTLAVGDSFKGWTVRRIKGRSVAVGRGARGGRDYIIQLPRP